MAAILWQRRHYSAACPLMAASGFRPIMAQLGQRRFHCRPQRGTFHGLTARCLRTAASLMWREGMGFGLRPILDKLGPNLARRQIWAWHSSRLRPMATIWWRRVAPAE